MEEVRRKGLATVMFFAVLHFLCCGVAAPPPVRALSGSPSSLVAHPRHNAHAARGGGFSLVSQARVSNLPPS